jgi:uncharacterized membrane protein YphA (DoxX/SURF4 family)
MPDNKNRKSGLEITLWVFQWMLALLFLFAGGAKLAAPIEELTKQVPLPGAFLRFIAVAEILGAFGLILPGLLKIQTGLTTLAAACLVIIMIGATVITMQTQSTAAALLPLVTGLLLIFVAYGRWRLAPLRSRNSDPLGYRSAGAGS